MATFNLNAIPPQQRTKEHVQAHMELYKKTQDIIRVHNPTSEDFIVYNDRMVTNEQWVIPNKDRDMGAGKGNFDVPRYIARRYLDHMGKQLIQEKSKREWEKIKGQYRADERGEMEGRLAIKMNDLSEWKKITPKLWLGVVQRYTGGNMPAVQEVERKPQAGTKFDAALEELELSDYELKVGKDEIENNKQSLIDQIT